MAKLAVGISSFSPPIQALGIFIVGFRLMIVVLCKIFENR
jgi:hypothetical protein